MTGTTGFMSGFTTGLITGPEAAQPGPPVAGNPARSGAG
jgi:hypothetical protein